MEGHAEGSPRGERDRAWRRRQAERAARKRAWRRKKRREQADPSPVEDLVFSGRENLKDFLRWYTQQEGE